MIACVEGCPAGRNGGATRPVFAFGRYGWCCKEKRQSKSEHEHLESGLTVGVSGERAQRSEVRCTPG